MYCTFCFNQTLFLHQIFKILSNSKNQQRINNQSTFFIDILISYNVKTKFKSIKVLTFCLIVIYLTKRLIKIKLIENRLCKILNIFKLKTLQHFYTR